MIRLGIFLLGLLVTTLVRAADIETSQVLLRGVDKVTGRTSTMVADVGEASLFGNLTILVQKCLKKPPEETPENAAFLTIEETNREGTQDTVFNGWMFSSNPALSAMEHPIYDIWVLECVREEPEPQWQELPTVVKPMVRHQKVEVDTLEELPLEILIPEAALTESMSIEQLSSEPLSSEFVKP